MRINKLWLILIVMLAISVFTVMFTVAAAHYGHYTMNTNPFDNIGVRMMFPK